MDALLSELVFTCFVKMAGGTHSAESCEDQEEQRERERTTGRHTRKTRRERLKKRQSVMIERGAVRAHPLKRMVTRKLWRTRFASAER